MASLTINGKVFDVDVEPDTPLLWAIRENAGLTGTKYGCGIAQCGACTVHIDGVATRSCSMPVSAVTEQQEDRHYRRAFAGCDASDSESLARTRRAAMRLLPVRADHGRGGAAAGEQEADRRSDQAGDDQHLSLRHLQSHQGGDQARFLDDGRLREADMNIQISRRNFLASSAAV